MSARFSVDRRKAIGNLIRRTLHENAARNAKAAAEGSAERRISSVDEICFATGLSKSTIYKLHSGDFSMRTLRIVEGVLGKIVSDDDVQMPVEKDMPGARSTTIGSGGYSYQDILPYLGRYLTIRQGTTVVENLLTTRVDIHWDENAEMARYDEYNRFLSSSGKIMDYSQSGTVHRSRALGVLHLLTSFEGAIRLVTLGRIQVMEPVMYGMILTQIQGSGAFVPTSSVVHFRRMSEQGAAAAFETGVVRPGDPQFKALQQDLNEARDAVLAR